MSSTATIAPRPPGAPRRLASCPGLRHVDAERASEVPLQEEAGVVREGARPSHVVGHRIRDPGVGVQLRNRLGDGLAVRDLELSGPARKGSHGLRPRRGLDARMRRLYGPGLVADDHLSRDVRSRSRRLVGGRRGPPASRMPTTALSSARSGSLRERSVGLEHMTTLARLGRVRGAAGMPRRPRGRGGARSSACARQDRAEPRHPAETIPPRKKNRQFRAEKCGLAEPAGGRRPTNANGDRADRRWRGPR